MFIITNRQVVENSTTLRAFGKEPNKQGPNEIRMVYVEKVKKSWKVKVLPNTYNELSSEEKKSVAFPKDYTPEHTSAYVAASLMKQARENEKNILFFVHGYNNDVKALLDRMDILGKLYNVIPVGFSWPANGGGARGVMDYLSDKRDARASTGALERTLQKAAQYVMILNDPDRQKFFEEAEKAGKKDYEKSRDRLAQKFREKCPFKITLMCHSMGNYLYKQVFKSTITRGNPLLFDNVILAAADVNLLDHALWVDLIKFRNRLYVAINENDGPLGVSRMKMGDEQLERLGHAVKRLTSKNANYIDFTHAEGVGDSHSYFQGDPVKNPFVRDFWHKAINGEVAEEGIAYLPESNLYRIYNSK